MDGNTAGDTSGQGPQGEASYPAPALKGKARNTPAPSQDAPNTRGRPRASPLSGNSSPRRALLHPMDNTPSTRSKSPLRIMLLTRSAPQSPTLSSPLTLFPQTVQKLQNKNQKNTKKNEKTEKNKKNGKNTKTTKSTEKGISAIPQFTSLKAHSVKKKPRSVRDLLQLKADSEYAAQAAVERGRAPRTQHQLDSPTTDMDTDAEGRNPPRPATYQRTGGSPIRSSQWTHLTADMAIYSQKTPLQAPKNSLGQFLPPGKTR